MTRYIAWSKNPFEGKPGDIRHIMFDKSIVSAVRLIGPSDKTSYLGQEFPEGWYPDVNAGPYFMEMEIFRLTDRM